MNNLELILFIIMIIATIFFIVAGIVLSIPGLIVVGGLFGIAVGYYNRFIK